MYIHTYESEGIMAIGHRVVDEADVLLGPALMLSYLSLTVEAIVMNLHDSCM